MVQLIVFSPSQCRDSGDIKFIRNGCDLRFAGVSENCWSVM